MNLAIFGAGGHGAVVADIAVALGFNFSFFDDASANNTEALIAAVGQFDGCVVAIGRNDLREQKAQRFVNAGFEVISLIHPRACVSGSAIVGEGVVVMPNATVNARAVIADGAILNSNCVIEHDAEVGRFAHVAPQSVLGGGAAIGEFTLLGSGAVVLPGKQVPNNCVIGLVPCGLELAQSKALTLVSRQKG